MLIYYISLQGLVPEANITVEDYCLKENKLTKEEIDASLNDDSEKPSERFLCYLRCVFTETGMIKENGKLNVGEIVANFEETDESCLEKIDSIKACSDMEKIDECSM